MPDSVMVKRVALLSSAFLVSFSLYGLYCFNTVAKVKINGPFYARIAQSKDVVADILPPPEYLVETYLTAFEMFNAAGNAELESLAEKANRLRSEYLGRHDHWERELPDIELKRVLVKESFEPARRMLDTLAEAFVPALRAGNRSRAQALLSGSLRRDYEAHRAKVDQAVILALKRKNEYEAEAGMMVRSRIIGQAILGFSLFLGLSILAWAKMQRPGTDGPPPARTA